MEANEVMPSSSEVRKQSPLTEMINCLSAGGDEVTNSRQQQLYFSFSLLVGFSQHNSVLSLCPCVLLLVHFPH